MGQGRSKAWTRTGKWKGIFLRELAESGNVTGSCKRARVAYETARKHRQKDKKFGEAWDLALEQAADLLEAEARRRAYTGWEEPVFGSGGADPVTGKAVGTVEVGRIRRYSDTLLIVLLKGCRPEKYRENFNLKQTQNNLFLNWDQLTDGIYDQPRVTTGDPILPALPGPNGAKGAAVARGEVLP